MITHLRSVARVKLATARPTAVCRLAALLLLLAALLVGMVSGFEIQVPWRFVTTALLLCAAAIVILVIVGDDEQQNREDRL
jgi:hypothetical protein